METQYDFLRGDNYETEWQHNKADALDECIILAGELTLAIEHLVDEDTSAVEQRNITEVYTAVKKIAELRYYEFTAIVEGKYQVYEEKLEYDFTKQLMEFLDDTLGYNYKELFV